MEELWKDILWYEWKYQVSNLWRVKSLDYNQTKKEGILKPVPMSEKLPYMRVRLAKNKKYETIYIHRLVAEWFLWLDISNKKTFICHKDDNPRNNRLDNLFLWTAKENTRDMLNKWRWVNQNRVKKLIKKWIPLEKFDRYDNYDDNFYL